MRQFLVLSFYLYLYSEEKADRERKKGQYKRWFMQFSLHAQNHEYRFPVQEKDSFSQDQRSSKEFKFPSASNYKGEKCE